MSESSVNVLIVDDRPDKLMAIEAVLEELGQNLVRAQSGREALRQLLKQEFAVVLLDVNMPGMDGFETAQMIRQRQQCADVPLIFLTAMGDETHLSRSYSLGAVDYILTPVVPQVLRAKVSVFVDLFRKRQQVRLQAERLRQRAAQLHQLTTAAISINSAVSVDRIVEVTTETARQIVGTHQAMMVIAAALDPTHKGRFACYSSKYADAARTAPASVDPALMELLNSTTQPMRIVQRELETKIPTPRPYKDGPLMRGILVAPLSGRDGRSLGWLFLSDKMEDDFSNDDQAVLTQLAQMASVAIENVLFVAEREAGRLKETFLSTVSHELRTPLSAMSGWIQLLRNEPVNHEVAHGLEVIERNVQVQTKLIEDLLDLSRISTGKLRINPRPVSLHQLLTAAVDAMRPVFMERQLTLHFHLNGSNPTVMADPERMHQVFWNLLSNAAKFTPAGGSITVHLQCRGGSSRVTVQDTGQGIDRDFLPHVFQRFRQADSSTTRRHGGLGIGLAIVKHLVELHGGSVIAESAGKGCGAVFTVTLAEIPGEKDASGENAGPASARQPASLEGMSVLLVDDHPDAREVLGEILRRHHAQVASAASVHEALGSLACMTPHVLVTDLGMPDEDGYALLRHVRNLPAERGGRMPAIAVTAHASAEERETALAAGFQAHLAKPVDPDELISAVDRFGRGRP